MLISKCLLFVPLTTEIFAVISSAAQLSAILVCFPYMLKQMIIGNFFHIRINKNGNSQYETSVIAGILQAGM